MKKKNYERLLVAQIFPRKEKENVVHERSEKLQENARSKLSYRVIELNSMRQTFEFKQGPSILPAPLD